MSDNTHNSRESVHAYLPDMRVNSIAARAPSGVTIVTNPKAQSWSLRSTVTLTLAMLPYAENKFVISCSVVVTARFSKYILVFMNVLRTLFYFPKYLSGLRIRSSRSASASTRSRRPFNSQIAIETFRARDRARFPKLTMLSRLSLTFTIDVSWGSLTWCGGRRLPLCSKMPSRFRNNLFICHPTSSFKAHHPLDARLLLNPFP